MFFLEEVWVGSGVRQWVLLLSPHPHTEKFEQTQELGKGTLQWSRCTPVAHYSGGATGCSDAAGAHCLLDIVKVSLSLLHAGLSHAFPDSYDVL